MNRRCVVCPRQEVNPGQGKLVEAFGKKIALFNIDGKFYAIDDLCKHAGASLSQGEVEGKIVRCPLHGAEFDIFSGKALTPPAEADVRCYKVICEGDQVIVEVP